MLKKEGDKLVCREFKQKGIYRALKQLDNDTVIYCTDQVIEDFEAFVSGNVRIRRAVNTKNITLQKIKKERATRKAKKLETEE